MTSGGAGPTDVGRTTDAEWRGSDRLPSLDGWRALSICMVLGAHCTVTYNFPRALEPLFKWIFDGELGVRVFFIISGLLITWLMLSERERTGRFDLGRFYARRALRILPVYFAFLAVLALLQSLTPFRQPAATWLANVTLTTNFLRQMNWVSGHLWSLAVEEQFYLLWPGLFLWLANTSARRKYWWALSVPLLAAPIVRVVSYLNVQPFAASTLFSGYTFFKFFDSLAIGCICAIVLARQRGVLESWLVRRRRICTLIALLLILTPFVLSRWLVLGVVTIPFGPSLQGAGVAALLLQSVLAPDYGCYPLLNSWGARQIGVLSYSIYIWQEVFCANPSVFGSAGVWWLAFPTWLIPALVVALISYYGLERPLFRLRARLRG